MSNKVQTIRLKAFQDQDGRCFYCNNLMWLTDKKDFALTHAISIKAAEPLKCTAEHLVASRDGGKNNRENIVAACRFCNQARHRRKNPPGPTRYKEFVQRRVSQGKWNLALFMYSHTPRGARKVPSVSYR
jgi:5-methylcytosine-specific restriction endonuclease McrA